MKLSALLRVEALFLRSLPRLCNGKGEQSSLSESRGLRTLSFYPLFLIASVVLPLLVRSWTRFVRIIAASLC
ncbi:hypothetical protein AA15669_1092 [Saccharibacter floricola DSM 15669]|uniref:Uncharacterized protein n=1 Tax=Saccharibacter floricola DSM 15669 TaxID=1123227 RepID=A0ABQ0NYQ7_9PROT|nr:hypothetical protein AA15669_1092 [Saccharibacter floricola DSM 15669]